MVRLTAGQFTQLLLNLVNIRDLFGVGTKLKEIMFRYNQINSTVTARTWVFVNRMDQNVAKCRIGTRMKKWWWSPFVWVIDFVLHGTWVFYRINRDEGDESLPTRYQCNFSEIFKGRQIILKACRNSKYPIRCLL